MKNRYLIFAGCVNGGKGGGWEDFLSAYDDKDRAITAAASRVGALEDEWAEVIDVETLKYVWTSSGEIV